MPVFDLPMFHPRRRRFSPIVPLAWMVVWLVVIALVVWFTRGREPAEGARRFGKPRYSAMREREILPEFGTH